MMFLLTIDPDIIEHDMIVLLDGFSESPPVELDLLDDIDMCSASSLGHDRMSKNEANSEQISG